MSLKRLHSLDEVRRGVPGLERDPDDTSPSRFNDIATDDIVLPPVRTLDQDVGLDAADDGVRRLFVEDHGRIDAAQGEQHLGPFLLGIDRPRRTFVAAHRAVGIDTHDQRVTERTRIAEIPNMSRMKQVKHTVGEHDTSAVRTDARRER